MQDLISVIVPIYNVEKYLERCIQSIQNQTYTNLEIILIDDGSPDKCGEICDRYAALDDRIKVIQNRILASPDDSHLLTIALDGENSWENYAQDGSDFSDSVLLRTAVTV